MPRRLRLAALLPGSFAVRKLLIVVAGLSIACLTALLAGPVMSGGLFLLFASPLEAGRGSGAEGPGLQKGYIDLASGLYIRENDDLSVPGTPALVLRRTYLANYRVPRVFGVGATHPGEIAVDGDLTWARLILAKGSRVNFTRTSPGASVWNAMFEAEPSSDEWDRATLGWTGFNWALRRRDGALAQFRPCGGDTACSITSLREHDGRTIYYRRDRSGLLLKMDDGGDRWIALEYDDNGRITRAHGSTGEEARYVYDAGGRLIRVVNGAGAVLRYTYTTLDQLATIEEPGTSIENIYDGGLVVRQVNRYPDGDPYVFDFTYERRDGRILATESRRSDGSWLRYTWDETRQPAGETFGLGDLEVGTFVYERDPVTGAVAAVALTCRGRDGQRHRHTGPVQGGGAEKVKEQLLRTHCVLDMPHD
jgi:YD repeat-containing protein